MDAGSYSHVRRGAMPSSSAPAASSYKTNVNRTKTRKWVEAKVQSYDGDDWGNDDDYDDNADDQHDEPEPPPSSATRAAGLGPRQPGQTGYQLPSSRTFPQSAAASSRPSNPAPRLFGQPPLRGPGGHPSLHVQTQSAASATTSPPYATESAFPATVSSRPSDPFTSYSAGPTVTSTPSRFPPRKSSMGQHDRPNLEDKMTPKPDSRPGSSAGNPPRLDQPSPSPGQASAPVAKPLPFIRPSDIYKRVGEEKERERERLSVDSERPSMEGVHGRTEGASSPAQFRSSMEQYRRTSLESHDGSEPARARKSSLAPVAERKSEYGMDGFLVHDPTSQPPAIQEPPMTNPEPPRLHNELGDEAKADLAKSRRFSTSPQLPNLTRVSGFGDDFFSGPKNYSHKDNVDVMPVPMEATKAQPAYALEDARLKQSPIPIGNSNDGAEVTEEEVMGPSQPPLSSSSRPQLPGTWVSESTAVPTSLEPPPLLEEQEVERSVDLADLDHSNTSPMAENHAEPSDQHPATDAAALPSSVDGFQGTSKTNGAHQSSEGELGSVAGQRDNSRAPGGHYPTPQLLPPLKTGNLLAQPSSTTASSTPRDNSPQKQTSSTDQPEIETTTGSEFSPTAPLNTTRAPADSPDFVLSSPSQAESVMSTVETISPEKESDKLREEIMKSLSPAPHSPASSGLPSFNTESNPGDFTRESRYLSGVYDDYLSLSEEKSLQEVSQAAKSSALMASSHSPVAGTGSFPQSGDAPVSQPAPVDSVRSPASENPTTLRRFSWQHEPEEVTLSPAESRPAVSMISQDSLADSRGSMNVGSEPDIRTESPLAGLLQADAGGARALSPQVSQVSSRTPDDSLGVIESPSPISLATTRPNPASEEPNMARLSLADEKEKMIVGDAQSVGSNASEQHPALMTAPEQDDSPSAVPPVLRIPPVQPAAAQTAAPTPFREILNLATYEQRVQRFDETREQFYIMESGLSDWLTHLQSQTEHTQATAWSDPKPPPFKSGAPPASAGASSGVLPPVPAKTGTAVSHSRRTSIGNMQQLMGGQSGSFGASGNQVGTKSKELLHAAGAFGNKGMKSGMKLFNKGKNKLRR
ncbi:hypothetical protein F5Y14DRAFT_74862 [Nemania sp. NC0429]|nr:hypothetical protein F5Y14DRAFT_74862 [Nemania sp. NC0429]